MSEQRPRLLFDENIGRPYVDGIKQFIALNPYAPHVEVVHIFERFAPATWDEVWVPEAAKEGFVLISSDKGKKGGKKKGEKLPRLCIAHGLRHVLISNMLHQQKMFDKALAILSVWHQLVAIAQEEPGCRYSIEPTGPTARGCAKLIKRPPPANISPPAPPGALF